MALTLPYPNMDFTPLDILTADEMDQLVANIEFISQQFPISSSNIDWSSYYYKAGDVINYRDTNVLVSGRERAPAGQTKNIACAFIVEKPIDSSVNTITFTPQGYIEAFDERGVIFSTNDSTKFSFTCAKSMSSSRTLIRMQINILDAGVTISHNHACAVAIDGKFTLS